MALWTPQALAETGALCHGVRAWPRAPAVAPYRHSTLLETAASYERVLDGSGDSSMFLEKMGLNSLDLIQVNSFVPRNGLFLDDVDAS